jgi:hypothetical protein
LLLPWARERRLGHLSLMIPPLSKEKQKSSMETATSQTSLLLFPKRSSIQELQMCWMRSQKTPDIRERKKSCNLMSLLTKMIAWKNREKETIPKEELGFQPHPILDGVPLLDTQSQITLVTRLILTKWSRTNLLQVLLSRLITPSSLQ